MALQAPLATYDEPILRFSPLSVCATVPAMAPNKKIRIQPDGSAKKKREFTVEVTPLPSDRPPTTGELIRYRRQLAGLWQEDLAETLKVTPQTVSKYERGRDLSTTKLNRIAAALGISVSELMPPEPDQDPQLRKLVDVYNAITPSNQSMLYDLALRIYQGQLNERGSPGGTTPFETKPPRRSS